MEEERRLKSWFLGPKAENADVVERLLIEVFRDHVYWRRNFHPEDGVVISQSDKLSDEYLQSIAKLKEHLYEILSRLKMQDVPFFSPRYVGHMTSDLTIPSIIGYISTIFYDPNNVSSEASPYTTVLEIEVGKQLGKMLGYDEHTIWGHITAGGTIANIEALWAARNLKFFPLSVKKAIDEEYPHIKNDFKVKYGEKEISFSDLDLWGLLNLPTDEVLLLRENFIRTLLNFRDRWSLKEKVEVEKEVDEAIYKYSLHRLGFVKFIKEFKDEMEKVEVPVIIVPQSKHYSLVKTVELLGLGSKDSLLSVQLGEDFSINIEKLKELVENCKKHTQPIIAVVGIVGSTEEGAIDDIGKIQELQKEKEVSFWVHADAAWGGYFTSMLWKEDKIKNEDEFWKCFIDKEIGALLSKVLKDMFTKLQNICEADSITIDPHKQGYVPYPCGAIVFKNKKIRDLLSFHAPYIFHIQKKEGTEFIGRYILEGSKPGAAAVACYLSHKVIPLNWDGYGYLMAKTIAAAQIIYERLPKIKVKGIKVIPVFEPQSNLVNFVVNFEGNESLSKMNALTDEIYRRLSIYLEETPPPVQLYESLISKTEFHYDEYHGPAVNKFLEKCGIPKENFVEKKEKEEQDAKISVLRMTCMNPFLLHQEDSKYKYVDIFINTMEKILKSFSFSIFVFEDEKNDFQKLKESLENIAKKESLYLHIKPENAVKSIEAIEILKRDGEKYDFYIVDIREKLGNGKTDYYAGIRIIKEICKNKKERGPVIIFTKYSQEIVEKNVKPYAEKEGWGSVEGDIVVSDKNFTEIITDLIWEISKRK